MENYGSSKPPVDLPFEQRATECVQECIRAKEMIEYVFGMHLMCNITHALKTAADLLCEANNRGVKKAKR